MTSTPSNNAATLTYRVAPHPFGYQRLFSMLIANTAAENRGRPVARKRWWSNIWGTPVKQRAKESSAVFAKCFARQLEAVQSRVVVSVSCALLSHGKPQWGVLWATAEGLYFQSSTSAAATATTTTTTTNGSSTNMLSPSFQTKTNDVKGVNLEKVWENDVPCLREALQFKDVVALLPSVAFPTAQDGPPYVSGIPNLIVIPNALQVFTVSPQQIYQFVYMDKVTVVPLSDHLSTECRAKVPLLQHEYDAIQTFPDGLDAVTFSALTERLWEARLASLQIPLLRDGVEYAEAQ